MFTTKKKINIKKGKMFILALALDIMILKPQKREKRITQNMNYPLCS